MLSKNIEYETDYDLLIMSDMLITDWSTIYVDYLCLDKPIIFLDNPNPNKFANSSVIETLNNKRSKNYELLNNEIEQKLFNQYNDILLNDLKDKFYGDVNVESISKINYILKNINN